MNELRLLDIESAAGQADSAEPVYFDAGLAADQAALADLLTTDRPRFVHDTILQQIAELVELRCPDRKLSKTEIAERVEAHLGNRDPASYGTWVLFPWSARLVKVLPKAEFREVRTARNRYKITSSEQARLAEATIGVVGLSVGNMAAVTFALEGVGGTFVIADFDELSLSNLNRLRGGVNDLAVNKTVLAAREMYELDPYLVIHRFPAGVNDANMDDFLLAHCKLDLLVEECDDLYVKIAIRERCRELRIPVVMDTSDRGLLDVERYDLQPGRPVLHGLVGDTRAERLRGLPTKEKVPIVLNIRGGHAMSPRMAASLPEVEQSISTWPQLASGVALGGAITADAARRILLGEYTESGRYYVDVETIVRDGTGMFVDGAPPPPSTSLSAHATRARDVPPAPKSRAPDLANQVLTRNLARLGENRHMTVVTIRTSSDGDMVISGSHDDIYLLRSATGKVETLELAHFPVGIGFSPHLERSQFGEDTAHLEPGDLLFIGSDGVTECARGGDYRSGVFGEERLIDVLVEHGASPLSELRAQLLGQLDAYSNGVYHDDVSFLMLRTVPRHSDAAIA